MVQSFSGLPVHKNSREQPDNERVLNSSRCKKRSSFPRIGPPRPSTSLKLAIAREEIRFYVLPVGAPWELRVVRSKKQPPIYYIRSRSNLARGEPVFHQANDHELIPDLNLGDGRGASDQKKASPKNTFWGLFFLGSSLTRLD